MAGLTNTKRKHESSRRQLNEHDNPFEHEGSPQRGFPGDGRNLKGSTELRFQTTRSALERRTLTGTNKLGPLSMKWPLASLIG